MAGPPAIPGGAESLRCGSDRSVGQENGYCKCVSQLAECEKRGRARVRARWVEVAEPKDAGRSLQKHPQNSQRWFLNPG